MKYKNFINQAINLGCEVEEHINELWIRDSDKYCLIMIISRTFPYNIDTDLDWEYDDKMKKLFDIAIELARTPLAER